MSYTWLPRIESARHELGSPARGQRPTGVEVFDGLFSGAERVDEPREAWAPIQEFNGEFRRSVQRAGSGVFA